MTDTTTAAAPPSKTDIAWRVIKMVFHNDTINAQTDISDFFTPDRLIFYQNLFNGPVATSIESTPYRVARTRPLIADGDDRIGLLFPLAGRFGGEQGGREVTARRGEATTMVADRTGWFAGRGTQVGQRVVGAV